MRNVFLLLALSFTTTAWAASVPRLDNLTSANFDTIVKQFSANQNFYSVSPASSLGKTWGFEFGLVPGVTHTAEVQKIAHDIDPSVTKLDWFPHAAALARVGVPFGITGELQYFPKKTISNVTYKQTGGSLGWTITDVFLTDFFASLAVKGFYTSSSLSFNTTLNNSSTGNANAVVTAKLTDKIWGFQGLASREFFGFLEPYVGLGYAHANGTLGLEGTGTVTYQLFSSAFTTAQSATTKAGSAQMLAGFNIQAFIFVLGAEYNRVFGTDTYNAKLSFRF